VNTLHLQADRPGGFRGQCAEFCGLQHAHMALYVVAEPEEEFARWQARQRQPAPEPATDEQRDGLGVFLSSSCVLCHTINGTSASQPVPCRTLVGISLAGLSIRNRRSRETTRRPTCSARTSCRPF
jgi:hypothetical protein